MNVTGEKVVKKVHSPDLIHLMFLLSLFLDETVTNENPYRLRDRY